MEIRYCHYCHQEKPWVWSLNKLKDGTRIYVDKDRRRWAGKRCPDCEYKRVKKAVRYDPFQRVLIRKKLEEMGYRIIKNKVPLTVEKTGQIHPVNVRRAYTQNNSIVMESSDSHPDEITVLLFESVRVFTHKQICAIQNKTNE